MATTDLENSNSMGPRSRNPLDRPLWHRLSVPGIVFLCCTLVGISNCQAQDVAEAAKQERTRKENQQKHPKHVYTEDDLRHSRILTPEDSQRLEARRKEQTSPVVEKLPETIDAESAPAQLSLGEIARQYRNQKQARQPQQSAEFHLPFSNPPLAAPVRPLQPVRPLSNRKDPFLRPPAPRPSLSSTTSSRVVAPISYSSSPALHIVTVQGGDSLWKLAQQNLGKGSRWPELLALNSRIANPSRIEVGAQIYIPTRYSVPGTGSKIRIRAGDTLWKIAQTHLGRATYWPCIARANSAIRDANQIYPGQELVLPAGCGP